jgi:ATP-binding cassette subfamily A (ABC1) protein 3
MVFGGFFFLGFCLVKDHLLFEWFFYSFLWKKHTLPQRRDTVDSDVKREADRIENMTTAEIDNGNLVLKGLTKFYGNHLAVNQLNLFVDASECFGLLGINGAGKTTTFKMMTNDELISSGDAFIQGYSMKNQMHKVRKLIGYCPQFDALLLDLTGRETLRIFSLLRGIPLSEINEVTNKLSTELGFNEHLDKQIKAYSGGNKRKLSTALSLIGNPSLIFLDEVTIVALF